MNGEYLRGEVYWVTLDGAVGSEIQTGRPAVIVSGNAANRNLMTMTVCYMTSQEKNSPSRVNVVLGGEERYVVCHQMRTIDRSRVTRYIGQISNKDMDRVAGALAVYLCLPVAPKVEDKPKEESALKVKAESWRRMYEKVMDMYVELKVSADLNNRVAPVVEPEVEQEPELEEEDEVFVVDPVDVNSCSLEDLMKRGCSLDTAMNIQTLRPYTAIDELREVPGITGLAFELLARNLFVTVEEKPERKPRRYTPPTVKKVSEKVNVNTASRGELHEKLGINPKVAAQIEICRNRNGKYSSVDDLLNVPGFGKTLYNKYASSMTVGEVPGEIAEPEEPKINVNTATQYDLMNAGFTKSASGRITSHRKRYGPYKSVDDLMNVDGVTGKTLRDLRAVLEV